MPCPPSAACAPPPPAIRSAREPDHGGFFESALHHEIWRPQGFKHRVETVLRGSGRQLLGPLVLYLGPGERCLSASPRARSARWPSWCRPSPPRSSAGGPTPGPQSHAPRPRASQLLPIDALGQVCHASPATRRLLMLARGGMTRERPDMPLDVLAGPLLELLLHRMRQHAPSPGPCLLTQEDAWGQFTFAATPLLSRGGAQDLVQVMIPWCESHPAALQRALRRLALTAGQAAGCPALYERLLQTQISRQMGVSPATVIDHVRKVDRAPCGRIDRAPRAGAGARSSWPLTAPAAPAPPPRR